MKRSRRVELPEIVDEVRFFTQGARQPWTPTDTGRYEITVAGDEYVVHEDGVAWDPERLAESVGSLLFHRVYTRALASFPHDVELAVACVVLEGRRLVLVGDALAGTTALTTALLYRGATGGKG